MSELSPSDVEYLFRAIHDDLGRVETRLRSLSRHFGPGSKMSDKIEIAVSNVMIARCKTAVVKREALKQTFPHREHAGECEDW